MTDPDVAFLSEDEYRSIEDELEGTEKGRRFLRAHLERNRSSETVGLLRSIARLHRVTVGKPSFSAEVHRDIKDILRNIVQLREKAQLCRNDTELSLLLLGGLHEIEACLMALSEAWEESRTGHIRYELDNFTGEYCRPPYMADRKAKLFNELSSLFSANAHCGPADAS